MKKRSVYIFLLLLIAGNFGCRKEPIDANFEDTESSSIYNYLVEHKEKYSSFISILEKAYLDKTLSAYNPFGTGYTLFAPDNNAISQFISQSSQFSSLEDLLNNQEYVKAFGRYHIINSEVNTNQFPFGAFPSPTLSGDYLTVSFILEQDTSFYKINNQAIVVEPNIDLSNGLIHQIGSALIPVTHTTYQWISNKEDFSIFREAVDITGIKSLIDINLKESESKEYITLLIESDSIYQKYGISKLNDLINLVSPERDDYTDPSNPLYNFVAYHILTGNYFMDDFEGVATNYTTMSEVPLNINGTGLDVIINKGKEIFDTLIFGTDTTVIDHIGFFYDESNIITQSGPIHLINNVMQQRSPSRAIKIFEFREETLFDQYRQLGGTFLIEEAAQLNYIDWEGTDLFYVGLGEDASSARDGDYLMMNGDFVISYSITKIVQGKYMIYIGAEAFNSENAFIQVLIDNKLVGGKIDLSKGGSSSRPFRKIEIGSIDFNKYSEHTITVKALIPGRFLWDYIRFEPI